MKISKRDIFVFLTEFVVFYGLFWLIDSYVVDNRCKSDDTVLASVHDPIDNWSEEQRQVYDIVMDECIYDMKLRYQGADNEEFYLVEPCMYVAKDVVRVIFNPGTLSSKYTIHDVYQESKDRVVKAALKEGLILPKGKK